MSTPTTVHWAPKVSEISRTRSGRATAAEFTLTLSAPSLNNRRASSSVRTPPPTVSGMKTCSAVRETTSSMVVRPSTEAVMS